MADGGWGVPLAPKVSAFEGEVSGDEELVAGGWFEDGAVVADAEWNGVGGGGAGPDAVDHAQFAGGICCRAAVGGIRHRFQSKSTGRELLELMGGPRRVERAAGLAVALGRRLL